MRRIKPCTILIRYHGIIQEVQHVFESVQVLIWCISGKFLGFMLTKRGVGANLDKCQAIIGMLIPSNIKEFQ